MSTKTNMSVSSVTDSEEGQPVLSEHLHPGRRHESGVSRDDVRGHCLPASQGPGRHGEAPLIPQQVMMPTDITTLQRYLVTGLLTLQLLDVSSHFLFCQTASNSL